MIKKQIISPKEAIALIKAKDRTMWGGFMGCGTATTLSKTAASSCPHRDLTLICNDGGWGMEDKHPLTGTAFMIKERLFSHFIGCHIGLNKELQRQMNAGELDVTLLPMGSFIEKMRAAGSGLGGVLTPTGLGTEVAEGKQVLNIEGKDYLLELPLHANIAFIKASVADKAGNLIYEKTARNFNPIMAMAADIVVAEADMIVEIGQLDPDAVHTPMIFVDYLVQGER